MNGYLLVLLCSIYFSVCTDSMDRQYSIVFLPYGNRQYAVQFQESLSGREDRIEYVRCLLESKETHIKTL